MRSNNANKNAKNHTQKNMRPTSAAAAQAAPPNYLKKTQASALKGSTPRHLKNQDQLRKNAESK